MQQKLPRSRRLHSKTESSAANLCLLVQTECLAGNPGSRSLAPQIPGAALKGMLRASALTRSMFPVKHPARPEGQDQITRASEERNKGLSMYTHACLQRWGDWISENISGGKETTIMQKKRGVGVGGTIQHPGGFFELFVQCFTKTQQREGQSLKNVGCSGPFEWWGVYACITPRVNCFNTGEYFEHQESFCSSQWPDWGGTRFPLVIGVVLSQPISLCKASSPKQVEVQPLFYLPAKWNYLLWHLTTATLI